MKETFSILVRPGNSRWRRFREDFLKDFLMLANIRLGSIQLLHSFYSHASSPISRLEDSMSQGLRVAFSQVLSNPVTLVNDNNNEILIKREPLVYTRVRRAVQKKRQKN